MSSLKREYTRNIQNIWQAFYDHDEKRIDLIKKEIILRLNKYCEYHNQFCHQSEKYVDDDEEYEKREELAKRLIDYYNLPEKLYRSESEEIIPKSRIRLYEKYIKNNFCKGIPAKNGHYIEELDDLDNLYIFFGVPLDAAYDWPKGFYSFGKSFRYYQVLYYIENRKRWKDGFSEEHWQNGNLCTSGSYVNGFPHGIWTLRSPDGKKHHFIEWEDGYINGINYFYSPINSELVGMDISKNGQYLLDSNHHYDIERIKKMHNSSLLQKSLYKNNMLNHPYEKSKKKKHGKFKVGNGDWYFEGEYNNNIPVGIWREYLDNKLIYELAYKDGEIDLENSIFRYKRTGTPIPWNKLK
jgi:antitoxin component YwqK of YwqJK toxin-antitoxin module